ncbi:MAG: polysaccharide ABC transporter ATP-binding protein [Thermodesulfobacteriota bacterium]
MIAIDARNVTKEFRLGQLQGFKDRLLSAFGRQAPRPSPFKALDDVSFTVEKGEVLGIIGENGAGKSTLLKLLAGVSSPTSGSLNLVGSIAPLIEIGAGFHPELTGRENIFLNGAILGLPKKIIQERFDDIVSFAELEEFIDTPIKRYSSGMAIRLGFAVAISIDPEILIIDEVLAVGDIAFQRKCFDRMERLIKDGNRTVILVSHNIRQVERICSRAILLEQGKILMDGNPDEVCSQFFQSSNRKIFSYFASARSHRPRIESSGEINQLHVELVGQTGPRQGEISSCGPLSLRIRFQLESPIEGAEFVIGTHTADFFYLTANSTALLGQELNLAAGPHLIDFAIPALPLAPGIYCVRIAVFDGNRRLLYMGENLQQFSVVPKHGEARQPQLRTIEVDSCWAIDGKALVPSRDDSCLQGNPHA